MDKYISQAVTLITAAVAVLSTVVIITFGPPAPSIEQEMLDLATWQEEVVQLAKEQDGAALRHSAAFGK